MRNLREKPERINPQMHLTAEYFQGKPIRFILDIPVRRRRRSRLLVTPEWHAPFFEFLKNGMKSSQVEQAFQRQHFFKQNGSFLKRIGFLLSEDRISGEAPFEPYWNGFKPRPDWRFHIQRGKVVPPKLKKRLRGWRRIEFGPSRNIVWMEDPSTRMIYPSLIRDELPRSYPHFRKSNGHRPRDLKCKQQTDFLTRHKYVYLPKVFPSFSLEPIAKYYDALTNEGYAWWDESYKRHYFTNDAVARFFHFQLNELMNRIIATPVKPSYTFAAIYRSGAILTPHVDRDQCEYTLTVNIRNTSVRQKIWPLFIHTDRGKVSIGLKEGDGILFKGRELEHSRDKLENGTCHQLLFHFVYPDFKKSLY